MSLEGPTAALLVALASGLLGSPSFPSDIQTSGSASIKTGPPSRGSRVTVALSSTDTRTLRNATVIMTPDTPGSESSLREVAIMPDGSFVFTNVPPGPYRIRARAGTASAEAPLIALHRIVVDTRDMDVTLTLTAAASLSGRLRADAVKTAAPATLAGLHIQAPFADGVAETATGDVLRNGTFTIGGLTPGRHFLVVEGLVDPWVLQAVTYRGQDVTDAGLDIDSGQSLGDVRITITDVTTEVSGTVRDDDGHAVPGARVLIMPGTPQLRTPSSRRFGMTTSDAAGRFRYRGLPPGEYRIVASMIDPADIYRPEILNRLGDAGVPLNLEPLAAPVIDLRLTPVTVPADITR